jgi:hypothetical protein
MCSAAFVWDGVAQRAAPVLPAAARQQVLLPLPCAPSAIHVCVIHLHKTTENVLVAV